MGKGTQYLPKPPAPSNGGRIPFKRYRVPATIILILTGFSFVAASIGYLISSLTPATFTGFSSALAALSIPTSTVGTAIFVSALAVSGCTLAACLLLMLATVIGNQLQKMRYRQIARDKIHEYILMYGDPNQTFDKMYCDPDFYGEGQQLLEIVAGKMEAKDNNMAMAVRHPTHFEKYGYLYYFAAAATPAVFLGTMAIFSVTGVGTISAAFVSFGLPSMIGVQISAGLLAASAASAGIIVPLALAGFLALILLINVINKAGQPDLAELAYGEEKPNVVPPAHTSHGAGKGNLPTVTPNPKPEGSESEPEPKPEPGTPAAKK